MNNADFHQSLHLMFADIKRIQDAGGIWVNLPLNGKVYHTCLKIPIVLLVIGDGEGHDDLCGHYKKHSLKVQCLCHDCNVPTLSSDNP